MDLTSEGSGSCHVTPVTKRFHPSGGTSNELTSNELKRIRVDEGRERGDITHSACWCDDFEWKQSKICPKVINYSHLSAVDNFLEEHSNKYGSVTKNIEYLFALKEKYLGSSRATNPVSACQLPSVENNPSTEDLKTKHPIIPDNINLEDDTPDNVRAIQLVPSEEPVLSARCSGIIHLEDEELRNEKPILSTRYSAIINLDDEDLRCKEPVISARSSAIINLDDEDLRYKEPVISARSSAIINLDNEDLRNEEPVLSARSSAITNLVDGVSNEKNMYFQKEVDLIKPAVNVLTEDLRDLEYAQDQELMKDNICLADKTENMKDISPHLGLEADIEMEKNNGQTDANYDVTNISEIKKEKGVHVGEKDDAEMGGENEQLEVDMETDESNGQCDAKYEDLTNISEIKKDKGEYVGVEDDSEMEEDNEQLDNGSDGLDSIWNEMAVSLECSEVPTLEPSTEESTVKHEDDCEHSFILKDDIGYVCRICGLIQRAIETIIEYQYAKVKKNTRTYRYEGSLGQNSGQIRDLPDGFKWGGFDDSMIDIALHPRHRKLMKPHQLEGFNFLVSNLVTDNPGGCIMAHAPGSGKTFMIISFLQSFMAKYPSARPLIVLPRGILSTWKKEIQRWQVEEIPVHDFYSSKADNRAQQLEVLKQWTTERSILLVGYKQFSSIIYDIDNSETAKACQEILLTCPSILILDEGHTPRNQGTDTLNSLERIQTSRKVVLSGTLYQNHVEEVFNVLNLVRPKFLELKASQDIKVRILSRAEISGRRESLKKYSNNDFFETVEHTLFKDKMFSRKVNVIKDLREMTSNVLHYYKGDNLDELPGLVDFSVFLELSPLQKPEVAVLKRKKNWMVKNHEGSNIYVHPQLKTLAKGFGVKGRVDEEKIDLILEKLDVREGVKAKFYLNLLQLCEASGEKLLVFSQYLLPLKFLERLTVKVKGYSLGKEIFTITGDSDSEIRDSYMELFNSSSCARVFFGSIKACGEGISLVGASRIIILDVHLNPSVTRQAIGRAFRPGQLRKVYTYRLIASDSPEEDDHLTCFRKEHVAKMWFEWNGCMSERDFEMETVHVMQCGDFFLEAPRLNEDVVSVYKR